MDKPLRHEDYLAIAEENRRLKEQVYLLTTSRQIRADYLERIKMGVGASVIITWFVVNVGVLVGWLK